MAYRKREKRSLASILPLFAPAFQDRWQLILPGDRLVVYLPEREVEAV